MRKVIVISGMNWRINGGVKRIIFAKNNHTVPDIITLNTKENDARNPICALVSDEESSADS